MSENSSEFNRWRLIQTKLDKLFVHDLKNPISALSANLSFLDTALVGEAEEVRGAVSDSILASEMLLRFAENLNLIAMLEAGEKYGVSQVGLDTFVQMAVQRNKKFAGSAGVRLEIAEPLANAFVNCQYRYAELALENLILSAVRHSPQGGEVIISSTATADEARISVCDHGRPVSDEKIQAIFSREEQSEAKKHSGSRYGRGLGIYAVGLAVKALEWEIAVGTKNGMTEFALVFPLSTEE